MQNKHPNAVAKDDAFSIGWQSETPAPIRKRSRLFATCAIVIVLLVAGLLGFSLKPAQDGTFAFGTVETFEGTLLVKPVPMLAMADGSNAILVGPFKSGLPEEWESYHGKNISFSGTRIEQGKLLAVEITEPETLAKQPTITAIAPPSSGVPVSMQGELLDTKCYLGVMRPGFGRVHRACAVRCLSGGIVPSIRVRQSDGTYAVIFLAGDNIPAAQAGLELAVNGTLVHYGDIPVLHIADQQIVSGAVDYRRAMQLCLSLSL